MSRDIEEARTEADQLGLKYSPNIGLAKLEEKIEGHYATQAAGDIVTEVEEETEAVEVAKPAAGKLTQEQAHAKMLLTAKAKAFETRIVTITSNDKRDNHVTTTAYLSMDNQYFGKSKYVPLDVPVELEKCLIDVAKDIKIMLHVDEIVDGKRTGNKRLVCVFHRPLTNSHSKIFKILCYV